MRVGVVVAAVALAGCGDNTASPFDGARGGSRLDLEWFDFDGGARLWAFRDTFFDTELAGPCTARAWTDGNTYCTPRAVRAVTRFSYADAGCTQPLSPVPSPFFIDIVDADCGGFAIDRLVRGEDAVTVAEYFVMGAGGSCTHVNVGGTFFPYGDELTGTLVKLERATAATDAELAPRWLLGDDGTVAPIGAVDRTLGDVTVAGGVAVPVDVAVMADVRYTDAACTSAPQIGTAGNCPMPSAITDGRTYFAFGAATGDVPAYSQFLGGCVLTPQTLVDPVYYAIGDALELPVVATTTAEQAGRLELRHDVADAIQIPHAALFDREQMADCIGATLPDGTVRCLPVGPTALELYDNVQCIRPLAVVDVVGDPPRWGYTAGGELHELGAAYTGNAFAKLDNMCERYTPIGALYALGAAVDVTAFVPGEQFVAR